MLAGRLMNKGYCVFSPISMTHPIAMKCKLPGTWKFWSQQDTPFISWCDEFHVYCLPGWEESVGIADELKIAKQLGKRVAYH